MIGAVIYYGRNTLVAELPMGTLDLQMKLSSIGVGEPADRIPLKEDEERQLQVKLYASSPEEAHLLSLLTPDQSLADANTCADLLWQAEQRALPRLKCGLLSDSYRTMDEFVEAAKKVFADCQAQETIQAGKSENRDAVLEEFKKNPNIRVVVSCTRVVGVEYTRELSSVDDGEILTAREAARAYNESLHPIRYDRDAVAVAAVNYDCLLDLTGTGIMGYVEIPKIRVNLPIYHGTEETELRKGIGHLVGSSLPIGGIGEHSVLTGHSGVAERRLFSDLEQLAEGDRFYLHILGETLAYKVTKINTVLPHETDLLTAVPDDDLCTLVTCTPYGVNSHRLLVRGSRIPLETSLESAMSAAQPQPMQSSWKRNYMKGILIGCGGAAGAVLIGLAISFILRKRRKRHETYADSFLGVLAVSGWAGSHAFADDPLGNASAVGT